MPILLWSKKRHLHLWSCYSRPQKEKMNHRFVWFSVRCWTTRNRNSSFDTDSSIPRLRWKDFQSLFSWCLLAFGPEHLIKITFTFNQSNYSLSHVQSMVLPAFILVFNFMTRDPHPLNETDLLDKPINLSHWSVYDWLRSRCQSGEQRGLKANMRRGAEVNFLKQTQTRAPSRVCS